MPFAFSTVKALALRILCLAAVAWPGAGAALDRFGAPALPALPEASVPAPGRFSADQDQVAVGYDTRQQKWGVRLDEYIGLHPSLTAKYGTLINKRFGAGARLQRRDGVSEVVVNGVYAPAEDMRVRLTAGQLQATGAALPTDGTLDGVSQNSYLLDIRKYWGKDAFLSDFGIAAYAVDASASGNSGQDPQPDQEFSSPGEIDAGATALGRMNGYSLKFSLRPTPYSRLELGHGQDLLAYRYRGELLSEETLATSRLKYTQHFGDCMRFSGNFSTSDNIDRMDLKVSKDRWSFGFSRALSEDANDTTIQLGFSIPLGGRKESVADCSFRPQNPPAFTPMAEAATIRPAQLPGDPLAISNFQ